MTTAMHARDTQRPGAQLASGSSWLPTGRLLRAEFLKLSRRRGLMIAAAAMTVGAVLAYLGLAEALHLGSPSQYPPVGGVHSLARTAVILDELGAVVAILLGASVGAADVSSGVFRNLVTTGRSRSALFLARIPAGLTVSVAFMLAAYALGVAGEILLAGSQPGAPAHLILATGGWLIVNACLAFLLGLGLSSLTGSQSTSIAILLGLTLVVTPLLGSVNVLPDIRQALPGIALSQLQPTALGGIMFGNLTMTTTAIAVVLGVWGVLAVGAGLWRTARRDA